MGAPHLPVLLDEVLEWLRIRPDGIYVDATLGAGGHSAAIAVRLSSGRLISLDRDAQALAIARERLKEFASRVTFVHIAFSRIAEAVQGLGIAKV
ncbi:MAG: 16S rRNA (cytosine(1402)-N(4))-methyltransferase, partial [Candidatus Acidiferrales bacterium]